ncbi:MAG: hypothetical protein JXR56_02700 [Candidatus Cloacimonetes bacterium]|nr:hypothetical protein [Candidatus Cloacimonadota bacterium]
MKKVIIPLILLLAVAFLIAVESDPSDVVGYVKYDMVVGRNLIALPMNSGLAMAGNLGNAITGATSVSKWNPATQGWVSSNKVGMMWLNNFAVANGEVYMVTTTTAGAYYCAGAMIVQPNYSIIAGRNTVMVPLDRSDLTMAGTLGAAITGTTSVSRWNEATQGWVSSNKVGMMWLNNFAISIGKPLMITTTAVSTWPAVTRTNSSTFRSAHGRAIK